MYNAEHYIEQTLSAILNQTLRNFDLLIVDDMSTDFSVLVAQKFLEDKDIVFHIISLEENQGVAFARNTALHATSTKYMVFVDADDIPHADMIEKEYTLLKSDPDLMGVTSWTRYVNEELKPLGGGQKFGARNKNDFLRKAEAGKRMFLPIQTMFERDCALAVGGFNIYGFPEGKPRYRDYCEDLDLWTRMSDLYVDGRAIIGVQEYLYDYRKIDGLSSNHFNMIIKMNYVKFNVKRRRQSLNDLSFKEYLDSLDNEEIVLLKRYSKSADDLRNGVFYFRRGNIVKGCCLVLSSICNNPWYFFDKIKHIL